MISGNDMATRNIPANQRDMTMRRLRTRACLNHFKRVLLGDRHRPGSAQTTLVFKELSRIRPTCDLEPKKRTRADVDSVTALGMTIAERTWSTWFSKNPSQPQSPQIEALDKVALQARLMVLRQSDRTRVQQPASFFWDLVYGGLLDLMILENVSKEPLRLAHARIAEYEPRSALHLHFDALELLNFRSPLEKVHGDDIALVAGPRILGKIQRRWGERRYPGILDSAYAEMGSERLRDWLALPSDEQQTWLADTGFAIFDEPQDVAEAHLLQAPKPELLGEEVDAPSGQIYRLLFAVAADTEFLRDGRMRTWALDLATASAAAIAMFYAGSLDMRARREQTVLNALDTLFFGELTDGEAPLRHANMWGGNLEGALQAAMKVVHADWQDHGTEIFYEARRAYLDEMAALGVSLSDIRRARWSW